MSSAADDRLIMGKRTHSRTTRSRRKAREIVAQVRLEAEKQIAQAFEDEMEALDRERDLIVAIPRLEEFEKHWLTAGFFRRVWNAVRYVFIGSDALPRVKEEQTWQS